MAKECNHAVPLVNVYGQDQCIECVTERLKLALRGLSYIIKKTTMQNALEQTKEVHHLSDYDIILMGWVWTSWKERNE